MNDSAAKLAATIITVASRYVGLREVKPNKEWDNPTTPGADAALNLELRALMQPSPWEDGWAYCAAFCEGVVARALLDEGLPECARKWRRLFTPGVLRSYQAFREIGCISAVPVPGATWLAQHGHTQAGHAGLVKLVGTMTMTTIEANTSHGEHGAKDREGDWITTRMFSPGGRGDLRTLGFIHPATILSL